MKKNFLTLLLVACWCASFAQTSVNNLHYILTKGWKTPKKSYTEETSTFNFNWNEHAHLLIADKQKNYVQMPRHIIDPTNKFIVVEVSDQNEYILEETDSFFKDKQEFKATGETQQIAGFKCFKYEFKKDNTIKGAVGSPTFHSDYCFWVTDELAWNSDLNAYLYALIQDGHPLLANPKGVIVKFEFTTSMKDNINSTVILLDTEKLNTEPKNVTWPWEEPNGVAWIEGEAPSLYYLPPAGYDGSPHAHFRRGDGSLKQQNIRLKALLQKVTRQPEPRTKKWMFENWFWG
jgi:hypothetical protein